MGSSLGFDAFSLAQELVDRNSVHVVVRLDGHVAGSFRVVTGNGRQRVGRHLGSGRGLGFDLDVGVVVTAVDDVAKRRVRAVGVSRLDHVMLLMLLLLRLCVMLKQRVQDLLLHLRTVLLQVPDDDRFSGFVGRRDDDVLLMSSECKNGKII